MPTTTKSHPTRKAPRGGRRRAQVSRKDLIASLQKAYEQKGEVTPTTVDADEKKYGLYGKYFYMREFGSWNGAVREAGLPVNEWNRRDSAPQTRAVEAPTRLEPSEAGEVVTLEEFIQKRIEEERQEIGFLQGLLESYQSSTGRKHRVS